MIVCVAGMQRSGSTFAFNVARDVLRNRGSLYQGYATEIAPQLVAARDAQHILLKAHRLDALGILLARRGAVRVICTVRRPEDAVASWMRAFGFPEGDAVATIRAWLSFYEEVRNSALTVDYDTIDARPVAAARRIAKFLFHDVSWVESLKIARRHSKGAVKAATDRLARSDPKVRDIGFTHYHEDTLYHRKHVQSLRSQAASELLPPQQLSRVRQALSEPREAFGVGQLCLDQGTVSGLSVAGLVPVGTREAASFLDGFRFRNSDIWNLPLARLDDRWDLFNHIIASYLAGEASLHLSAVRLRFLEIGVWTAGTLSHVVERFGRVFDYTGVDPYGMLVDDPYRGMFWKTDDEAEATYQAAKAVFDRHGAVLIRTSSREFFEADDSSFDIVFVDGDRRYAGALYDCETAFGRLRTGGLLIVDDVGNSFHPEVEWAVREFTNKHRGAIRRMGAQPLFFQLAGMPVPVVLIFTYFEKG